MLLGSVAMAMDVLLPGHDVGASPDAEDLAGLVSRHSWRAAAAAGPGSMTLSGSMPSFEIEPLP